MNNKYKQKLLFWGYNIVELYDNIGEDTIVTVHAYLEDFKAIKYFKLRHSHVYELHQLLENAYKKIYKEIEHRNETQISNVRI